MLLIKHFYNDGEVLDITPLAAKGEFHIRVLYDDGSTVDVIHWESDPFFFNKPSITYGDRVLVDYVYIDEVYTSSYDDYEEPVPQLQRRQHLTKARK